MYAASSASCSRRPTDHKQTTFNSRYGALLRSAAGSDDAPWTIRTLVERSDSGAVRTDTGRIRDHRQRLPGARNRHVLRTSLLAGAASPHCDRRATAYHKRKATADGEHRVRQDQSGQQRRETD